MGTQRPDTTVGKNSYPIYLPIQRTFGDKPIGVPVQYIDEYTLLGALPNMSEFKDRLIDLKTFFQFDNLDKHNRRFSQTTTYRDAILLYEHADYIAVYGRCDMPFYHLSCINEYTGLMNTIIAQCCCNTLHTLSTPDECAEFFSDIDWKTTVQDSSDLYKVKSQPHHTAIALTTINHVLEEPLARFSHAKHGWRIDTDHPYNFLLTVRTYGIRKEDMTKVAVFTLLPLMEGLLQCQFSLSIQEFTELICDNTIRVFVA